jgi:hypothetical protein
LDRVRSWGEAYGPKEHGRAGGPQEKTVRRELIDNGTSQALCQPQQAVPAKRGLDVRTFGGEIHVRANVASMFTKPSIG